LHQAQFNRQWFVALVLALALGGISAIAIGMSRQGLYTVTPAPAQALDPNTEQVAWGLFHTYMLPFEVASILLLVAMIGAVVMAKKRI
jgi:NADH-quinone oxidoreductase subunit J